MLLIWQGWGLLAIAIPVVVCLIVQVVIDTIFGAGYYSTHQFLVALALALSAAAVWFAGAKLNGGPTQTLVDPKTGVQYEFKRKHTIFWIPMQWLSPVLGAAALFVLLK